MKEFEKKTVLITGASGNIGKACALAFGREGAELILHSHQKPETIKQIRHQLKDVAIYRYSMRCH